MAGMTKVILQMRHGKIAPSLHASPTNENIDFPATPFVVQQQLSDWQRPILEIDGETRELPRRAGRSSFGAGGSNAHLVLAEYIASAKQQRTQVLAASPATSVQAAINEN